MIGFVRFNFVRFNMPKEAASDPMRSNRLYETGAFFLPIPGSKLPGYDRQSLRDKELPILRLTHIGSWQSLRDRSLASPVLHVEPKLHHVPILNDVVFSFDPKLACFSRFRE